MSSIYGICSESVCLYIPVYLEVVVCLYSVSLLSKGRAAETVNECNAGKVLFILIICAITHK